MIPISSASEGEKSLVEVLLPKENHFSDFLFLSTHSMRSLANLGSL